MTLIDLLTDFDEAEKDLTASELALYISLALVWNRLRRPEWFPVSRTELMKKAGMADAKRVDRARKALEEKGLISTQTGGRTSPRKYHIIPLGAQCPQTRGIEPLDTRGIEPLDGEQQTPTRGIEPLDWGHNTLRLGALCPTSQRENTEAFLSPSSDHSTTYIDSRRNDGELPEVPKEVMDAYQDEIRPIASQFELSKLADDVEQYGQEAVIKAIHRATIRNKRTLAYVEGILKRWSIEGYDEEGGSNAGSSRNTGSTTEDDIAKWAAELTEGL